MTWKLKKEFYLFIEYTTSTSLGSYILRFLVTIPTEIRYSPITACAYVFLIFLTVQGCGALYPLGAGVIAAGMAPKTPEVEKSDLTQLRAGASRKEVEEVLGDPILSQPLDVGAKAIYQYNHGYYHNSQWGCDFAICVILFPVGLATSHAESKAYQKAVEAQKGYVGVMYDVGNIVERFELYPGNSIDDVRRAAVGDSEAMFLLGRKSKPQSELQFLWYCRAAHNDHVTAQYLLAARFYAPGTERIPRNQKRAYLWYSKAMKNGDKTAAARVEALISEMNPADIKESSQLLTEWSPNAENCEDEIDEQSSYE